MDLHQALNYDLMSTARIAVRGDGGRIIRFADGREVTITQAEFLKASRSGASSLAELILSRVRLLRCRECDAELLDGEIDICSPCEAMQVSTLLRQREELDG